MRAPHPHDCGAEAARAPCVPLVVVLDEDDDTRRIVELWLGRHGMQVLSAADADDAARALGDRRADVLVCELRGRGAFAAELARAARALPAFHDVPLVVHTSRAGAQDRQDAQACGALAFLTKPTELATLLARVRGAVA